MENVRRFVFAAASMALAALSCAGAGASVDFASASGMDWRVWAGGFEDADAPQVSFSAAGMRLRLDFAKAKGGRRMAAPGPVRKPAVSAPCRLRMTVGSASGVDVDGIVIGLADAEGEKFDFLPADVVRDAGETILEYEIFDNSWRDGFRGFHPLKGKTHGRNRNDRIDFPAKLEVLYVRLKDGFAKGAVTFRDLCDTTGGKGDTESEIPLFGLSGIGDPSDWKTYGPAFVNNGCWTVTGNCQMAAIEHTRFPGLKPVFGMDEIRIATSRAYEGGVVQVRAVNASTREKHSFKMPWKRETRIPVGLANGTPWQIDMLTFWLPPNSRTNIDFKVISATGIKRVSRAEAIAVEIDAGNELHLMDAESTRAPEVVLCNTAPKGISVSGVLRVRDFDGKGPDLPFAADLAAGRREAVALPGTYAKGLWRVICDLAADDGSCVRSLCRFAVVADGKKGTSRAGRGKFRVGVCYHPVYFSLRGRKAALDAMERAGIRLARINGFQLSRCWKSEDVFDWSRTDEILDSHLSRGITVSAGIYSAPEWARKNGMEGNRRHASHAPVREGLMRKYAECIAGRYGRRIDYFELGNEWDLVPEIVLPEEEALRLHREAYEGFATHGVAGKLTTNGWSTDMDYASKGGSVRAGFQKRYMQAVKGCCAVHSVHMHGPFASYVKSVNAHLSRRMELGIDMPWFANETAMSTTGGAEREVAHAVWKKVVYAWAKGSVDYIWYNLFAAGWLSSDSEQGYGLFTADLHPRAGYPAIAGLVETLQGLDFRDGAEESDGAYLFSFAGEKNGFKGVALAGWLEENKWRQEVRTVRIRTDAKRAFRVDIFGNRTSVEIKSGVVEMALAATPGALLLEGASKAQVEKSVNH